MLLLLFSPDVMKLSHYIFYRDFKVTSCQFSRILRDHIMSLVVFLNKTKPILKLSKSACSRSFGSIEVDQLTPSHASGSIVLRKDVTLFKSIESTSSPSITSESMAVILPWVYAKDEAIEKFSQFYLSNGYDVMVIKTPASHIFHNPLYQRKLSFISRTLFPPESQLKRLIFHCHSIGAFALGDIIKYVHRHHDVYDNYQKINKSLIADSPLDPSRISYAFGKARADDRAEKLSELWLRYGLGSLYWNQIMKSFDSLKNCGSDFRSTTFLTSNVDKIGTKEWVEELHNCHSVKNVNGSKMKIFPKSPHVMHFRHHKQEYLQMMQSSLNSLKRD